MEDESASAPKKIKTERYNCAAFYKFYNKKEHLVEHMKMSYHSVHEPSCGVCKKNCRIESLREHLIGSFPKTLMCKEITGETVGKVRAVATCIKEKLKWLAILIPLLPCQVDMDINWRSYWKL